MTFACVINNSTVVRDWQGPLHVVRNAAVDSQRGAGVRGQRGQTALSRGPAIRFAGPLWTLINTSTACRVE